jgi:hypothetical protein
LQRHAWIPSAILVVTGSWYVITLLVHLPAILHQVALNGDATSPMVLAAEGHVGDYNVLYGQVWFDALTRPLPGHRIIWMSMPAAMAVGSILLLAWSSHRLWGRQAALVVAVIGTAVAPGLIFPLFAQSFHGTTAFATVVLGAFFLWLATEAQPSARRAVALASLTAVVLSLGFITDYLLLFSAFVPATMVLGIVAVRRNRGPGDRRLLRMGGCTLAGGLTLAAVIGLRFGLLQARAGLAGLHLASAHNVRENVGLLGRIVVSLGHGYLGGPVTVESVPSLVASALVVLAMASLVGWGVGAIALGLRLNVAELALPGYWAFSAAAVLAAFALSTVPWGMASVRYLTTLWWAIAVAVAGVVRMLRGHVLIHGLAALAVGLVVILNGLGVSAASQSGLTATGPDPPAEIGDVDALIQFLNQHDLHDGYGGFWQANAITWMTEGRVRSRSVLEGHFCGGDDPGVLCRDMTFTAAEWYQGGRGPTFLIVHDGAAGDNVTSPPSPSLGRPTHTYDVAQFTIYLYDHDIAVNFARCSSTLPPPGSAFPTC